MRVTRSFLQTAVDLLREQGIWVINIKDLNRELVEGRREPQRMGLYGMLSLGFIVSAVITVIGYLSVYPCPSTVGCCNLGSCELLACPCGS